MDHWECDRVSPRSLRRPALLERLVSFADDRFVAAVPTKNQFWFIVIARHLIPVDAELRAWVGAVDITRTFTGATVIGGVVLVCLFLLR